MFYFLFRMDNVTFDIRMDVIFFGVPVVLYELENVMFCFYVGDLWCVYCFFLVNYVRLCIVGSEFIANLWQILMIPLSKLSPFS